MKVLFVNTADIGPGGGIRAIQRVRVALIQSGVSCPMLVQQRHGRDADVMGPDSNRWRGKLAAFRYTLDGLPLRLYGLQPKKSFCLQWLPDGVAKYIRHIRPDVVFLGLVTEGFLRIESLAQAGVPVVWNLCDAWPYTGGCHFPGECDRFRNACGSCPQLDSACDHDLSRWIWKRKKRTYDKNRICFVSPSRFIAGQARNSSLLANHRVEIIPNPLNLSVFKPVDRLVARRVLNLPEHETVILFGAANPFANPNKGYDLLHDALSLLWSAGVLRATSLLVFGADQREAPPSTPWTTRLAGVFHDEMSMAILYSAADLMVVPSRHESFGQTASEALACGIPVVAFDVDGLRDIVDHEVNGYLARPYAREDLAAGIAWVLDDKERRGRLSIVARRKAEACFSMPVVATRYIELLNTMVSNSVRP